MAQLIKKENKVRTYNMLSTKHSLLGERDRQTESQEMEKDISCKWKRKQSGSNNIHIRQNRL